MYSIKLIYESKLTVFNQLTSGEIFGTFVGRRIVQKQKSYAMYHPFAHHLAQV